MNFLLGFLICAALAAMIYRCFCPQYLEFSRERLKRNLWFVRQKDRDEEDQE